MNTIDYLNMSAFYIGAILVSAFCIIYTLMQKNVGKVHNNIFITALGSLILSAVCDMFGIVLRAYAPDYAACARGAFVVDSLYFVLHNLLAVALCYYALFASGAYYSLTKKRHIAFMLPFAIAELIVLINPFVHVLFKYDGNYGFVRGGAEVFIYMAGAFYVCVAVYYLIFKWSGSSVKRKRMLIVAFSATVIGIVVQLVTDHMKTELFAESITFMGVMLSVEYEGDLMDVLTGVYNKRALTQQLDNFISTGYPFYVMVIKIFATGWYGVNDPEKELKILSEYLTGLYPRHMIYKSGTDSMTVMSYRGEQEKLAEDVERWVRRRPSPINAVLMEAQSPGNIAYTEDVFAMCECHFENVAPGAIIRGEKLEPVLKSAQIVRALERGIRDNRFEVVYQTIWSAKTMRASAAEGLVRLNDNKLGLLFPREFLNEAERYGFIDRIGDITLRDVFAFLESGSPQEKGWRYININLSAAQCLKPGFVKQIRDLVETYDINPSCICFEIAESAALGDYSALAEVVRQLKMNGFLFSMEGYGIGSSNMYAAFALEFDIIKIDKSLIKAATESDAGRIILENTVRMLKELNQTIVAVGIENKRQFEYVAGLGVEYMQGYYLSSPLPKNVL
ncbi:MAG: EAL domain-containing protein [Lachnospiraceae bacterium]|nr:EAL domain-containing protein [Lachnospiraceae bacterium]